MVLQALRGARIGKGAVFDLGGLRLLGGGAGKHARVGNGNAIAPGWPADKATE